MMRCVEWLYKNWVLGLVVVGCIVLLFVGGMVKCCEIAVSTVKYPAYNKGVYFLSTGEPYILGYKQDGEFVVLTSDMNEVFSSYDVKTAIPEGNVVRVKCENGTEIKVNMITKEVDQGGIFL